jgi:hypothetical protein
MKPNISMVLACYWVNALRKAAPTVHSTQPTIFKASTRYSLEFTIHHLFDGFDNLGWLNNGQVF